MRTFALRLLAISVVTGFVAGCPQPQNPDAALDVPNDLAPDDAADDLGDVPLVVDATAADVLRPPPIVRTLSEHDLAPMRRACGFSAGAWPAATLGTEYAVGSDIPINHVIVIMQENRSFDHY